jgi:hypothetical protein
MAREWHANAELHSTRDAVLQANCRQSFVLGMAEMLRIEI